MLVSHHVYALAHGLSFILGTDAISSPLILLSMWLLPLTLLASRQHLFNQPKSLQRSFTFLLSFLTFSLILTFSALDLIFFYVAFETTLIPTIFLITRWGQQYERLDAGIYFMFYTLTASLPLLISILSMAAIADSTNISLISLRNLITPPENTLHFWWLVSILAFLAKLPIYGVHL